MCGIAGFSLSKNSKINVRKLSKSLLTAIEDRGYMASGYAYQDNSGEMGVFKAATAGSKLSVKKMPKSARNVILHTRLATHGSINDNRNNHPVMSPSNNIALVHNGVIYNHHEVRSKVKGKLPDVDTSVIPAVIEQKGLASINLLDGDAAIAWFDKSQADTLHLARYQHSPLVMAQVEDGSFLFCSTETLLWRVLIELELMPVWMETANELEYYTISNGVVTSKEILPEPIYSDDVYDYSYYRHQTAGAKGSKPKAKSAYPYDDEDEYVYDPSTVTWAKKYGVTAYEPLDDYDDYLDPDDDWFPNVDNSDFYINLYDNITRTQRTLYYFPSEEKLWKDELWKITEDDTLTVLDYGLVQAGLLIPLDDEYVF